MEYYGNNDWRDYLRRQNELMHFGIPKRSGRYPWGSGEDPYHHGADAPGSRKDGIKKDKEKIRREGAPGSFDKEIRGRKKSLDVVYDTYSGEEITESQEKEAQKLLTNGAWLNKAFTELEKYCKEDVINDPDKKSSLDNIFTYINPKSVYITRERPGRPVKIGLMCNYRYDPEHGLVVVFEDGKIVDIGPQDLISLR